MLYRKINQEDRGFVEVEYGIDWGPENLISHLTLSLPCPKPSSAVPLLSKCNPVSTLVFKVL